MTGLLWIRGGGECGKGKESGMTPLFFGLSSTMTLRVLCNQSESLACGPVDGVVVCGVCVCNCFTFYHFLTGLMVD